MQRKSRRRDLEPAPRVRPPGSSSSSIVGSTARSCVTIGWEEEGRTVEERLGPKDTIFNPAGRVHYFRNDSVAHAEFMMLVGTSEAEDVSFQIG